MKRIVLLWLVLLLTALIFKDDFNTKINLTISELIQYISVLLLATTFIQAGIIFIFGVKRKNNQKFLKQEKD